MLLFALLGGFVSAGSYTRCITELRLAQEPKNPRNQGEFGRQCTVLSGQWYQQSPPTLHMVSDRYARREVVWNDVPIYTGGKRAGT